MLSYEQAEPRMILDELEQQIQALERTACTAATMGADIRPMLEAFAKMKQSTADLRELFMQKDMLC